MKQVYLLSYKAEHFEALNSTGTTYVLTCLKKLFWGLIQSEIKINYTIPWNHPSTPYFERWDDLIKSKKQLK
jgi:hypothetical protein